MKQIFINLSVANVEKSMHLYSELGFVNNPEFTDAAQKCMVWSEHIYVMLISNEQFNRYNQKKSVEVQTGLKSSYTLPIDSLNKVNEIVERGLSAGAIETMPMIDEGFMQVRTIEDFDGHTWGIIFLDMEKFRNLRKQ
jgi:uncharacterized protein